jgi:hypothetical protein
MAVVVALACAACISMRALFVACRLLFLLCLVAHVKRQLAGTSVAAMLLRVFPLQTRCGGMPPRTWSSAALLVRRPGKGAVCGMMSVGGSPRENV